MGEHADNAQITKGTTRGGGTACAKQKISSNIHGIVGLKAVTQANKNSAGAGAHDEYDDVYDAKTMGYNTYNSGIQQLYYFRSE